MIEKKRHELESFIREQIIGPGALGYRFIDINNKEILSKKLTDEVPINYSNELINTVPGALYSTGILFPIDNSQTAVLETEPNNPLQEENDNVTGSHESTEIDIDD